MTDKGEIRRDPYTLEDDVVVKTMSPPSPDELVLSHRIAEYPYGAKEPAIIVCPPARHDLKIEETPQVMSHDDIYDLKTPTGAHEYIVCDPNHPKMLELLLRAFRDRISGLRTIRGVKYVHAFLRSTDKQADGKLVASVVAFPVIAPEVKRELTGSSKHYEEKDRCKWCDVLREETKYWKRVIHQNDSTLSIVPYHQTHYIEANLLQTLHQADFSHLDNPSLENLSYVLSVTIQKIEAVFKGEYHLYIHTVPVGISNDRDSKYDRSFHTHIEIRSALKHEYHGTGISRLDRTPESLAELLRQTKI